MMDPSQFYGEWSWCHDGVRRECELILNNRRGGQSGGSPDTYWYINPDYTVMIGRLNKNDVHIFKVVDEKTLEIIEPVRNPPTRCIRVSAVPPRQKTILYPQQLIGEWRWQHNPNDAPQNSPHELFADGSIKNETSQKGEWKIEPDGHIFVGRLNKNDRHIFRVIDKNTLECIEPLRNPPTQMQRMSKAPKNPYKRDQLKLTTREMQVNSLAIGLLVTQKPAQFDFWLEILPQLFEMLLFQLSLDCSKSKVRTILEQAQIILNFAYENADAFAKLGLLQSLLRSPILERYLATSKVNSSNENLAMLLLADLKVQQLQCSEKIEQNNLTKLPNPGQVREKIDLLLKFRKHFEENKLTFEDKKNFLIEYSSALPKLACWNKIVKVSSDEQNKFGEHIIDLSQLGPFSAFTVKTLANTAQGNPDRVVKVKYGKNTLLKNLQDSFEFVNDTPSFQVNFNVLPKRYVVGVYPHNNQDKFKLSTSRDQLITSLKDKLFDQVICSTELGVYFWSNDFTEVHRLSLDERVLGLNLPDQLIQLFNAPKQEGWAAPALKVQEYFKRILLLVNGEVFVSDEQGDNLQKLDIGGSKVKDFCACKNTALFITESGELFTSGLTNLADGKNEGQLEIKKIESSIFPDLQDNITFSRCWIQSNDPKRADNKTGYVFVEVVMQREQRLKLYSFGINQHGCLGNGHDSKGQHSGTFHPLVYDFQENSFEQVFLSPQLALAVDIMGVMWLLGGKAQFKDNFYFPSSFTEINNFPLKTTLLEQLQLQFGFRTLLQCKKIVVADNQILLLLKANNLDEAREYPLCYQIQQVQGNADACSFKLLTLVDQTVADIACFVGGGLLLVERASTFSENYSVDFSVEPCLEKCITKENCEQIIQSVQPEWEVFAEKMQSEFETQFVFDVLDCINKYVTLQEGDCSELFFQNVQLKKIELSGQSFETEDDARLARVIIPKLIELNRTMATLYAQKLHTTFEADPFSFISPAMGLPTACRNWNAILKAQKRFLCDKLLEQQFLNLIKDLPQDPRSRIEITINRYAARRFCDSGKVDNGDGDTVFSQIMRAIQASDPQFTSWRKKDINSAVFRANFLHEGSIDAGGPYREAHEQMCREVLTGALPLLIPTENQRTNDGEMRDAFVLNHNSITPQQLQLFFKMGCWLGNAIRTGSPLTLSLHPVFWKKVVGADSFTLRDLKLCSIHEFNQIDCIREEAANSANNDDFQAIVDQNFTVTYGGNTIELCANGYSKKVTLENHMEYIRLAVNALLSKDDLQMAELKRGIYHVLSKQAIQSCSWKFAEERACGKQTIDIQILRQNTSFSSSLKNKKIEGQTYEDVFWKVLTGFSEEDKRLYLKFVTGRSKMPLDIKKQSYPHTVTSMGGNNATLPQAHICYNQIDMPPYTTEQAMGKRLLTAIQFCGEVDTDGVRHSDY